MERQRRSPRISSRASGRSSSKSPQSQTRGKSERRQSMSDSLRRKALTSSAQKLAKDQTKTEATPKTPVSLQIYVFFVSSFFIKFQNPVRPTHRSVKKFYLHFCHCACNIYLVAVTRNMQLHEFWYISCLSLSTNQTWQQKSIIFSVEFFICR